MKRKNFLAVSAAAIFVLCFALTVSGAHDVAEVSIGSSGVYWQPRVSYSQITLMVSCPNGEIFKKTFEGGTAPYFDLADVKGQLLDGSYTYELRVTPIGAKKNRDDSTPFKKKMSSAVSRLENPTQTGYFTVSGGAIITPGTAEAGGRPVMPQGDPAKPSDQVILDDLIVDGSICVGFDCINGESFGFDTLILKENNLRIYFHDTSSSASFPTNDWRIAVNDTTNGGASRFSIEDVDAGKTPFTIEAGAGANALYVDDYGRIGLGTSTPVVELEIAEGDTPTVRLNQDGSSGWAPQIWDVAGNEANFFIRDVTNGSKLSIRIQPGTPGDTLCLKADGKVGIGTWSPDYKFEIQTTGENSALVLERTDGVTNYVNATATYGNFGTVTAHNLRLMTESTCKMMIDTDGEVAIGGGNTIDPPHNLTVYNDADSAYGYSDGGAWATGSSRKFKENIEGIDANEAIAAFKQLYPIRFNYKGIQGDMHLGFIAEDVPEIVATRDRDAIAAMDIVTLLTRVVQEQQKVVEQHEKTIAELKKEVSELKKNR